MEKCIVTPISYIYFVIRRIFQSITRYIKCVALALRLPGPEGAPIVGFIPKLRDNKFLEDLGTNASNYFGPIFRIWILFMPFVFIYEPEDLKAVLAHGRTSEKSFFYRIMHTFIGDGLITREKWKRNRKFIQPYFQNNFLQNYYEIFSRCSLKIVQNVNNRRQVKVTELINDCVLGILHDAILGVPSEEIKNSPFRKGELLLLKRILKPWLLLDGVFKCSGMSKREKKQQSALHQYVKRLLDQRLDDRKDNQINWSTCLLDYFIDLMETTDFTQEDLLNECVTFMLAGQDSVGATIAFCLYYLARNQSIQEKLFQEIDIVTRSNDSGKIDMDQVMRMPYLEQCIKETLRLAPSVPVISRVLTKDVALANYVLPAGLNIFISPFMTHRLPHIFPNPVVFDPDRFSEEGLKNIPPYAFIPFSAGSRNCIGYKFAYLEIKNIIAMLVKNYRLRLISGKDNLSFSYRVTLRANSGVMLEFERRA
ncbi:putative cytochrome P450 4aa1 isoform X2 [Rhynchophorus ferrugineus]|uniref:putative cytochrome P450 4aa1 isoform X2 n=1 Tax=Rhynchophorus ferrugineus TaxID=354439 RepID=UPI003FCCED3C